MLTKNDRYLAACLLDVIERLFLVASETSEPVRDLWSELRDEYKPRLEEMARGPKAPRPAKVVVREPTYTEVKRGS